MRGDGKENTQDGGRPARRARRPTAAAKAKAAAAEAAAEQAYFAERIREAGQIAACIALDNDSRLGAAIGAGPQAIAAEWPGWKVRIKFAHMFATMGQLHRRCPAGACKRARACVHNGMVCTRPILLTGAEESRARARLREFVAIVGAPDSEASEPKSESKQGAWRQYLRI